MLVVDISIILWYSISVYHLCHKNLGLCKTYVIQQTRGRIHPHPVSEHIFLTIYTCWESSRGNTVSATMKRGWFFIRRQHEQLLLQRNGSNLGVAMKLDGSYPKYKQTQIYFVYGSRGKFKPHTQCVVSLERPMFTGSSIDQIAPWWSSPNLQVTWFCKSQIREKFCKFRWLVKWFLSGS